MKGVTRTALLLFALLFGVGGCRYTFWPLIPPEESYPERVSIGGELVEEEGRVIARLNVRRWPEPDYLELRWYAGEELVEELSIWVEEPGGVEATLPYEPGAYYRLLVIVAGRPVLQLDLGVPNLPPPPSAPDQEPAADSGS